MSLTYIIEYIYKYSLLNDTLLIKLEVNFNWKKKYGDKYATVIKVGQNHNMNY